MCAINPRYQRHLTISVYTTHDMTEAEFVEMVYSKLFRIEVECNKDARLRWHLKEQQP